MSEKLAIYTLPNGIRVIHEEVNSPISHFGVLVNAGTRDEPSNQSGVAHFVEHTIFKGTEKRNSYQVSKRMENAGGDLNASTAKEETYFHASFLSSDYERAIELLSDIFFHATFPDKEIAKEKDVVLEEINYYHDSPSELIFDEIEEVAFAGHPLGRNILGDKKSLRRLKREDIISFIRENYTANDIVLSSVGNLPLNTLLKYCNRYFNQPIPTSSHRARTPFTTYRPTHIRKRKNISQAHVMLCNTAYSFDKDSNVTINLTLPANLPVSLFPLVISVKDTQNALNPIGTDMPLVLDGNAAYHFEKTISWEEYQSSKAVTCNMRFIKAITSSTITIDSEYFNAQTATVTAAGTYNFSK